MFQLDNGARGSLEDLEFINLDGTSGTFEDLNLGFNYFAVTPISMEEPTTIETSHAVTTMTTKRKDVE